MCKKKKGILMSIDGNYEIKKGDTLWGLAKQQLQAAGSAKPTNAQIVAAMNKIAQANGCENAQDCADKFFNKIGSELKVQGLFVEANPSSTFVDFNDGATGKKNKEKPLTSVTYAMDENGSNPTTEAVNEEGGNSVTYATRETGMTTMALGEEGGGSVEHTRGGKGDSNAKPIISDEEFEKIFEEFKKKIKENDEKSKLPELTADDLRKIIEFLKKRVGDGITSKALGEEGGSSVTYALNENGDGITSKALGEEGGSSVTYALNENGDGITTKAMGEEGGMTTMALGEEGGSSVTYALNENGDGITTKAMGEEGGMTTMALGEEGGSSVTYALNENGDGITTKAMGEEGGMTTMALGEEGESVIGRISDEEVKRIAEELKRRFPSNVQNSSTSLPDLSSEDLKKILEFINNRNNELF